MTKSVAELAADVYGIRLNLIDMNKTPTAAMLARVQYLYDIKFAELSLADKAYWPADEIPDLVAGALARIIAAEVCGASMPIPMEPDEDGAPTDIGTKGWRLLNRLLASDPTGLPAMANYY